MGSWNLTIAGVGPHHNGIADDIDAMGKKFVEAVKNAGHTVEHTLLTYGAHDGLTERDKSDSERMGE